MLKVLTCLVVQHDHRLVLVAAAVCLSACLTAFRLYSRIRASRGVVRASWLTLTALTAGAGVWATHFIAMLAYQPGLPTGYSPAGTLASLLVGTACVGLAFAVASAHRDRLNQVAGGMVFGGGVAAMHYIGLAAFQTQGRVEWDSLLVAVSIALGMGVSILALLAADRARTLKRQMAGAAVLTLAICLLHFTGMGAATIIPDPSIRVPPQLLSGAVLTFAVASITTLIILGGLGAVMIEAQTSRSALDRIRRLANAAYEGLVVVQNGRVNDANLAFCELMSAPLARLEGLLLREVLAYEADAPAGEDTRREGWLAPLDGGEPIPVEIFARALDDGFSFDASMTVLAIRDLRERRSAEERIRYLAEHDGLTGLPNRNALQTKLAAALDRVEAAGETLAVICVDLDHFKEANDLHGHLAGDALLIEAARRLQAQVTAPSFAARLGGDEFIIIQIGAGDQAAAAGELANNVIEAMRAPYAHEGDDLTAGASLGVALYPDDGREAETLLANADMALYRAKEAGRGTFRFFKREMDETIRERRNLARELRQAISDEQLTLHYQPQANAADGEVCGFEALVRWNHPTRGMVAPSDFIPLAEESGLIVPLGEWVLRRACADAAAWARPLNVAVNLSPLQLHQGDLPKLVHEVLLEAGLSPQRLELEVTESALFKDYQRALDNLRRLKALGVRIAMDDFGTGFSSLSTLQSFPFDKIKIDKSFVENIHVHDRATVIVRAVLGLGRSLDIPVVAEGVETEEQIAFLRGEACAELQGYAIGRPAPIETMTALTSGKAAPVAVEPAVRPRRRKSAAA
ncbi:bifunctional diguanylate cyclase/phosphodiesterase [Caulobacter sp. CCUG 60055]|uniref:bifunctional diguanylate cyclase/phosphodiesterase n=2 Tax=Pseudomonadota TaxID=1224 RepID=UPI001FA810BA|nr:EAL domain-containing protein [Caulobacteraceae bacterium]MCI3179802.1 bifunctional diguanylate cyclase/phosphodiesterase [Caulobacter sp. CCUG 60055]